MNTKIIASVILIAILFFALGASTNFEIVKKFVLDTPEKNVEPLNFMNRRNFYDDFKNKIKRTHFLTKNTYVLIFSFICCHNFPNLHFWIILSIRVRGDSL